MKKAKKGEHRCTQTRCFFYLNGGCKNCESCNAPPYIINEGCKRCFSCESDEGELRFDDEHIPTQVEVPITHSELQEALDRLFKKKKKIEVEQWK